MVVLPRPVLSFLDACEATLGSTRPARPVRRRNCGGILLGSYDPRSCGSQPRIPARTSAGNKHLLPADRYRCSSGRRCPLHGVLAVVVCWLSLFRSEGGS